MGKFVSYELVASGCLSVPSIAIEPLKQCLPKYQTQLGICWIWRLLNLTPDLTNQNLYKGSQEYVIFSKFFRKQICGHSKVSELLFQGPKPRFLLYTVLLSLSLSAGRKACITSPVQLLSPATLWGKEFGLLHLYSSPLFYKWGNKNGDKFNDFPKIRLEGKLLNSQPWLFLKLN